MTCLPANYSREGLKRGLELETTFGVNPYKFGMVGSTDSHTALATAGEDNFFGKHTGYEPSPERLQHPFVKSEVGELFAWQMVASGLTGVWAEENTRESIFDALARKEVYATTGPRIPVRFFGGWDFVADDMNNRQPAFIGYNKGVPMGGDLLPAPEGAEAPSFMVFALRDPVGANLDRIQIIKGWLDSNGETHEQIYDVAWGGDRTPGADGSFRPSETRLMWPPPIGPTASAPRNWEPSGPTQTSILRTRLLLRACDRDPDPALVCLRRLPLRNRDPRRCSHDATGSGLHVADLVHA